MGAQDKRASDDKVATAVGAIVFWPALFFIGGDKGNAAEVGRLKGEMNALEQASIKKNCAFNFGRANLFSGAQPSATEAFPPLQNNPARGEVDASPAPGLPAPGLLGNWHERRQASSGARLHGGISASSARRMLNHDHRAGLQVPHCDLSVRLLRLEKGRGLARKVFAIPVAARRPVDGDLVASAGILGH
jgi:hypothetical protein